MSIQSETMTTFYLTDTDITVGVYEKLDESAPSSVDEAQGWVVDKKASPNFSIYIPDLENSTFVTTEFSPFQQKGYRSLGILNGWFQTGNWVLSIKVKCNAYFAQTGQVKFRLWKSTNADGSGATQITPGWQASTTISFSAANEYQTRNITWNASATTELTNQYLFLEIEWSAIVSGGNNTARVYWVHNEGSAEKLATPIWYPYTSIFSDGFESGDFSAWTSQAQVNGTIIVESANPHHGTYDAKADITVFGASRASTYKTFTAGNIIYGRVYIKFEELPPSDTHAAASLQLLRAGTQVAEAEVYNDGGTVKWALVYRSAGSYLRSLASTPLPAINVWYCLELKADMSTSDGTLDGSYEFWLDGVSLISISNVDTDYTYVDQIGVARARDAQSANCAVGTTFLDCVVVDSAYIGVEAAGGLSIPVAMRNYRNMRT